MVGSNQAKVLGEFYAKVFEREQEMPDGGGGWFGWKVGETWFSVGPHSEVKGKSAEPQRLILNLETADVEGEFERIKQIPGAEVIKAPYSMPEWGEDAGKIATFADPDGNYFQLMPVWGDQ